MTRASGYLGDCRPLSAVSPKSRQPADGGKSGGHPHFCSRGHTPRGPRSRVPAGLPWSQGPGGERREPCSGACSGRRPARSLVCLRTGRQAAGQALHGSVCGRGAERAVDSSCGTCGSGHKENPLAGPEAAIGSAWAVWKALEGSREGRSAAARHPCPVPSSRSHGLCAEMPAQLLTGPGGAPGRGCWPGCGPTAHHGEAGRWPCAGHSLTPSPWSRRGGRRMETHGHKSGVCFYWCFYFRFSAWKRTFSCIPGYLCENDKCKRLQKKGRKVRSGSREHTLVSGPWPRPLARRRGVPEDCARRRAPGSCRTPARLRGEAAVQGTGRRLPRSWSETRDHRKDFRVPGGDGARPRGPREPEAAPCPPEGDAPGTCCLGVRL